ncbi:gamma-glutamylcyclotransferase [Selenomonas sp. oral taxon 126]|uniref:gamma-glutamylcyclotransferase family protein n=1 Tax=Selenomonas sp. oral taxon 126 TaxID=712528 RepID=UPI000807994E|nr:gamma-glutamylcyclotransferase family protein [Selenomonas sp. oral taxon 126]ANR71290.1 gamma-glutamylcyclotransferase [Selenomonas sp. oral taxon 126]
MMKMKTKIYIAYGSNMDERQMAFRCPEAELLGTGLLEGWRLMFKGSKTGAYATIEKEKGLTVPILLWRISEKDEERLDRYEGFPSFYYKRTIQATRTGANDEDLGKTRGMVYIMHEERKLGVPSIHYLEVLAKAYEKFGFDEEILGEAYDYSDREPEKVPPESLPCLW